MSFLIYSFVGLLSGVLGGMGMGGGTILIPFLTVCFGVNQHVAQATNVISFLPMAAIILPKHKKSGLLKTDGLLTIIVPAIISTVLAGLIMASLPADILRRLFGAFLLVLAVREVLGLLRDSGKKPDSSV